MKKGVNDSTKPQEKRYEIDDLIHELALEFINVSDEGLDELINKALARIGSFANVDRSYIFQYFPGTQTMSNTHEWCSPDTCSHVDRLKDLPLGGPYEWLTTQLKSKDAIHIPNVDLFPSEFAEAKLEFQKEDIKSLVMVPLAMGEHIYGFMGFDAVRQQKEWSENDVHLLKLLSAIVAQTLQRVSLNREQTDSRRAIQDIVENMNAMVCVADVASCEIKFLNSAARKTLGDLTGKLCSHFEDCYRATLGGECSDCNKGVRPVENYEHQAWDFYDEKNDRWYQCSDQLIDWYDGGKGCLIIATDVTESRRAYQELVESRQRLSEAQHLSHIGNWELDLMTGELSWSDEIYKIFELNPGKFTPSYKLFIEKIHPEDRLVVDSAYTESVRNKFPYQVVHRLLLDNAVIKYVEERGETFYSDSGDPVRSIGTIQDITERKLSEITISRLTEDNQRLARESIKLLDGERKRLSHELHDEMGQEVTAIKLEADYLKSVIDSNGNNEISRSISDIIQISGELLDSVRSVSEGLYPSILEQFSLEEALRDLVETWANRDRDRTYQLHISKIPRGNSIEVKLAAYRVLQECLSNIVHHSQSKNVDVYLDIQNSEKEETDHSNCKHMLRVIVQDDGIGFNPEFAMHGIGFLSMRERVLSVLGDFQANASSGKGCIVTACFPLGEETSVL
jgi:signal transduction histidine kinase